MAAWATGIAAKQLATRYEERVTRRGPWVPTAIAASQIGYECLRRIEYQIVRPHDAEVIGPELASIFAEGDLHEPLVLAELEKVTGLRVENRNAGFRDERLWLVGRLDGEVKLSLDAKRYVLPVEVKTTASLPGEDTADSDMAESSKALLRRYFAQLQIYLYLRGQPFGLFVFKSKSTGCWRTILVELDYARCEVLLKKIERVRDTVRAYLAAAEQAGVNPREPMPESPTPEQVALRTSALEKLETNLDERLPDRSECMGCPFRRVCNPSMAPVDPALLATEAAFVAQLDERARCKPDRDRYEKIDRAIKDRLKLTAGDRYVVGGWYIEKKVTASGQTRFNISRVGGAPKDD